jgi:hypothetical protein
VNCGNLEKCLKKKNKWNVYSDSREKWTQLLNCFVYLTPYTWDGVTYNLMSITIVAWSLPFSFSCGRHDGFWNRNMQPRWLPSTSGTTSEIFKLWNHLWSVSTSYLFISEWPYLMQPVSFCWWFVLAVSLLLFHIFIFCWFVLLVWGKMVYLNSSLCSYIVVKLCVLLFHYSS